MTNGNYSIIVIYYGWKVEIHTSDLCWQDSCLLTQNWHLIYSENHWPNKHTVMGYLHNILIPYVNVTRSI